MLKFGVIVLILAVGCFPSLINAGCDMLKCRPVLVSMFDKPAYCSALQKRITCLATFQDNFHCAVPQRRKMEQKKSMSTNEYSIQCEDSPGPNDGSKDIDLQTSFIMGNKKSGENGNNFLGGGSNDPGSRPSRPECNIFEKCPHVTVDKGKTSAYCSALNDQVECVKVILPKCLNAFKNDLISLAQIEKDHKEHECGVSGLAASTLLCLVVCLMSMLFKG